MYIEFELYVNIDIWGLHFSCKFQLGGIHHRDKQKTYKGGAP